MWYEMFAWGKDTGQDDLHHLLSPCEHLSTPKHNIQLKIKIKTLNSNSVDFKGLQREFSPNSAQEYHQLSKNENLSFAIFTTNYKGKKLTIELKMESLSQRPLEASSVPLGRTLTTDFVSLPGSVTDWEQLIGSLALSQAMQWSVQEQAPSVSYTS